MDQVYPHNFERLVFVCPEGYNVEMMPLNWSIHQELLNSKLLSVRAYDVYLLSRNRNAWRDVDGDTISRTYDPTAVLFGSLLQAKLGAKKRRKQGNVFNIARLPALGFVSKVGILVTTEFHSRDSFCQLNVETYSNFLKLGLPLSEATLPFTLPIPAYWSQPFPSRHSFVQSTETLLSEIETFDEKAIDVVWESSSSGSYYELNWEESQTLRFGTSILKVLRVFEEENSESSRLTANEEIAKALEAAKKAEIQAEEKEAIEAEKYRRQFLESFGIDPDWKWDN